MNPKQTIYDLPFGTELGRSQGSVVSYSSDYDSADEVQYPNRSAYRSYVDGIYMGYKWQCVEFARRWLYINKGYIFNDVSMAYEIFKLRSVRDISNKVELPLNAFKNGSVRHPEPGCLLIWDEGGEFEETGHVAIITEVFADKIRIVEQNMDFVKWPEGRSYSREIRANVGENKDYWLQCPSHGSEILGWVIQTDIDDCCGMQSQQSNCRGVGHLPGHSLPVPKIVWHQLLNIWPDRSLDICQFCCCW